MAVTRPSTSQIIEIGRQLGIELSQAQAAEYRDCMAANLAAYDLIDAAADEVPEVVYPRTGGYRPAPADNPYNAWYVKCEVEGAATGVLVGKTVALKDNVCLAGVPMMSGTTTVEGYMPNFDATIVTRMLDAGATVTGKAVSEHFCLSGSSHTSDPAPVYNPHRHGYSAGGSSSGSAALVAAGEVDLAIGGDQGGSIRIPASFCGLVGMKATHGLLMPTLPIKAKPLPARDASITERVSHAFEMAGNVQVFYVTGHPALSLPCGSSDGLPIGLMLVGADYDEATIYRAASAFENRDHR